MHNVTSVKPDKVFLAKFLRCQLRPNEAVLFFPESITRIEKKMPEEIFFITVVSCEKEKPYPLLVPLNMLDFNEFQKKELLAIKKLKLPRKAFEKIPIAMDEIFRLEECGDKEPPDEE